MTGKAMMLTATAILAGAMFLGGCGEVTPPGKIVIVLKPSGETRIVEKGIYRALGRDKVYFVDQKLFSYTESMKILCEDDINMDVDVKTLLSFDVSEDSMEFIRKKVPAVKVEGGHELSLDQFYQMAVRDVVRSAARTVISEYQTDDIRANREQITADLNTLVLEQVAQLKYPLHISGVLISNIDYPESVRAMRERIKQAKLADQERAALAEASLAEAQRQVAIETEKAKVRMVRARAQADENTILTKSLTPQFLMWRQYEVMENLADRLGAGPNNTVFLMPYESMNMDTLNTAMMREAIERGPGEGGQ